MERTPKSKLRLLQEVRENLAHGRRSQVYVEYTNRHDMRERLNRLFRAHGIRSEVLDASVATDRREEWYASRLQEGVDVVVCHPRLVETGLDLLAFPTIVFYETSYSLHTLRQASRRSWRIGQTHPVRVLFLVAEGTAQVACVRLMGKKMLCALAIEGKLSGEGLSAEDTEGDLFSDLAKQLLQTEGVRESAGEVWGQVRRERLLSMGDHAPVPDVQEEHGPSLPVALPIAMPNPLLSFAPSMTVAVDVVPVSRKSLEPKGISPAGAATIAATQVPSAPIPMGTVLPFLTAKRAKGRLNFEEHQLSLFAA